MELIIVLGGLSALIIFLIAMYFNFKQLQDELKTKFALRRYDNNQEPDVVILSKENQTFSPKSETFYKNVVLSYLLNELSQNQFEIDKRILGQYQHLYEQMPGKNLDLFSELMSNDKEDTFIPGRILSEKSEEIDYASYLEDNKTIN